MTDNARPEAPPARRKINPTLKFALELGPLAAFFIAYAKLGIYVATGALMVCVVASLVVSYALLRRVPIMPLVTAVIVVIFGSLTLFFHNETLIKIKPTALYLMFAAALFGGMALKKPLLPVLFDAAFSITDEGWRKLTYRWAFFFVALAVLNEMVWRTQSTDFWVGFKTFGVLPLTVLFGLAQAPLIMRYETKDEAESDAM
jgi:intracellular septation protein